MDFKKLLFISMPGRNVKKIPRVVIIRYHENKFDNKLKNPVSIKSNIESFPIAGICKYCAAYHVSAHLVMKSYVVKRMLSNSIWNSMGTLFSFMLLFVCIIWLCQINWIISKLHPPPTAYVCVYVCACECGNSGCTDRTNVWMVSLRDPHYTYLIDFFI